MSLWALRVYLVLGVITVVGYFLLPGVARGFVFVVFIVIGVVLAVAVLVRVETVVRGRERAISRERILRDASAELVRAPDRESIYAATLEAVLPFIEEAPGTRVSVWSGSSEKDRCVAAAGHQAEEIRGKETCISDFPDWLRKPLLEGKTVGLKPGQPAEVREAFRFVTKLGAIFMVPLMVQDRFEGRITVASDSRLPGDIRYVLETLGSQVALALERTSLNEEVYRRRGDERFRKLVQNSSDVISVLEMDGAIRYESPAIEPVLGYSPDELVGESILDYVHPEDVDGLSEVMAGLLEKPGSRASVEVRLRHSDGSYRYLESTLTNLLDESDIGGVVINSRDVTGRKQASEELRKSEGRNRAITEAYPDLMFRLNRDGEYLDYQANQNAELYVPHEEIVGRSLRDTLPPNVAVGALRCLDRTLETGAMQIYEYQLSMSEGLRDFEARFVATDEDEALCVIRDITERRESEKRLQESEQRYKSLFEYNPDAVYSFDLEGNFLTANAACETLTGYPLEELLQMSFVPLIVPEYLEVTLRSFEKAARGEPQYYENAITHKDGHRVELNAVKLPIIVEGEIVGVYGIAKDITGRKRAEAELRESEERFYSAFANTPVGMTIVDLDGRYLQVNHAMCRILGYTEEELLNTTFQEITYLEDYEKSIAYAQRMWEGEVDNYSLEKRYVHAEGHPVWVNLSVSLVRDREGDALYHIAQVQDITGRKRAEEALLESEQRYRSLVELSPDAIAVHSEGEIVYVNSAGVELFGASDPGEINGKKALGFVHPDYRELVKGRTKRTLESGEVAPLREEKYLRLDGSVLDVEVAGVPIHYRGKPAIQVVLRDISERKKAEEDLRQSEERYRAVVERATDGIYIHDHGTKRIVETNTALQNMLGYAPDELPGSQIYDLIADSRENVARNGRRIAKERSTFLGERPYRRKDGSLVYVESSATMIPYRGKEAVCTILRDITGRKLAEEELRRSEARNKAILETTPDLIFIYDRDGKYLDIQANDPCKLYLPREELLGKNLCDLLPSGVAGPFLRKIDRTLDTGEMQVYEYQLDVPGGTLDFESRLVVSGPDEVLCAVRDITERKALEQRLEYQAFHDSLTGLPNRLLFTQRLEHALARSEREESRVAVLFMDLDNFKDVNDSLGHDAGDQLLVAVARLLREAVRPGDTVGRFGGDELNVLLEGVADAQEATRVVGRIEQALQAPVTVEGHEIFVSASTGIALSDSAEDLPEDLLSRADLTMYRAKSSGKSRHEVFVPGMEAEPLNRLQLGNDLRRAVERNEFKVCYQPKVHLEGGIVGMEALVRWEHPDLGTIRPGDFISVAEETGLILQIGHGVLEEACRQAATWRRQYPTDPDLIMCVNLSARQFQHPELAHDIEEVLRKTGLEPHCLELEITESVVMEDADSTLGTLEALKRLGVGLAIDDFGTGYSSLSYLKRFPIDFLKIDRSFVEGIEEDEESAAIMSGVINLAHTLGMKLVAEGVETAGQAARLRRLGCDMAQGNYFSEPLPAEAAGELLAKSERKGG